MRLLEQHPELAQIGGRWTLAGLSLVAGGSVFAGTGTAASVTGLRTGRTYTVVAYTVDKYGNVSAPVESSVAF